MYEVLKSKNVAKQVTDLTYSDYYYRLMLLARCIFKWEGLPNGIDEKWIEKYLFSEGSCMFFRDDNIGFFVSRCNLADGVNCNDEPISLRPVFTGTNFEKIFNKKYINYLGRENISKKPAAVLIRNNDIMFPTAATIRLYAYRLAEIQRTIDININAQKTPVLIKCTKNQKLTLQQTYNQYEGNKPVIFVDKGLDTKDDFAVLRTDAPIVFDKLQIQKHEVWNEVMTFLGINNANMDKRERLVDDEVQANNEQIEYSAYVMLKNRENAAKLINKLFPELNGSVKVSMRKKDEIFKMLEGVINVEG